ncbi:hypothetical protein BH18ACT5_BH18ACT5_03900 [soil metagenome]
MTARSLWRGDRLIAIRDLANVGSFAPPKLLGAAVAHHHRFVASVRLDRRLLPAGTVGRIKEARDRRLGLWLRWQRFSLDESLGSVELPSRSVEVVRKILERR